MALPFTFKSVTAATGLDLDNNFNAVGKLGVIPGAIAGTNTLTFTATAGVSPTITAYANYMRFGGVIAATNTTGVTFAYGALAAQTVYKDTAAGPVVLTGGELVLGNFAIFAYDSALGGVHLLTTMPISTMLDLIGTVTGMMLYRASNSWASLVVGNASQVLAGGTIPGWKSVSSVIDTITGATSVGAMLTRTSIGWGVIQPGASGAVLTALGVGTIPAWI